MPCSETLKCATALQRDLARESKFSPTLSHLLASDDDQVGNFFVASSISLFTLTDVDILGYHGFC